MASHSAQHCVHRNVRVVASLGRAARPSAQKPSLQGSVHPRFHSYHRSTLPISRASSLDIPRAAARICVEKPLQNSRCLSSSQARAPKPRDSQSLHDDTVIQSRNGAAKRKSARPQNQTSLRRVAAEAQYTRDGLIKRSGKRRFVDPEAETKQVTAYCAAELYNIPVARDLLKQEGYVIDPFNTGLYPQVIHVQTPNFVITDPDTGEDRPQGPGDVFVFPSGSIVTWNVPEREQHNLVHRILLPAAKNSHPDTVEVEDLEYIEDSSNDTSRIIGDCIILGIKATKDPSYEDTPRSEVTASNSSEESSQAQRPEADAVLAKIAFSSGLARSTKLAVLENLLSSYFSSTRSISTILSRGSKLRFTRSFILRKTGELLSIRAQLNLYSELTDSLPDLFWDSPSSLGLSDYYDEVGRALDVNSRIRVLNEKIDYASEIATVLRERLSEKHSTDLEWLIIFLISIEVVFELWRIWRERHEASNPESTEALFREYLLRERQRDSAN